MQPSNSPDNNQPAQPQDVGAPNIPPQSAVGPQPANPPAPVQPGQPQQQLIRAGEHQLTEAEALLFGTIYGSFEQIQKLVADFLAEKHGYPKGEPVAFQMNFEGRVVVAFRPSKVEVTNNAPTAPAQGQTPQ